MRSRDVGRAAARRGEPVDVERRGVGGDDRARPADFPEAREHPLLQGQVLEHRLDDHVAIGQRRIIQRADQQADAAFSLLRRHPPLGHRRFVVTTDRRQATLQRRRVGLDQDGRDADVGEVHRDAAAHGAGTDDADPIDRPRADVGAEAGDARGLALGEEDMAHRPRLGRNAAGIEQLRLERFAGGERNRRCRLDAANDRLRRRVGGAGALGLGTGGSEEAGRQARGLDAAVATAPRTGVSLDQRPRESESECERGSFVDAIDQAGLEGLLRRNRLAAQHHLEREDDRDEARQALRAERTGQHADQHLGQAELRLRRADAVVASERELEPAAECGAVQCGDDRPVEAFDACERRVVGLRLEVGIVEGRQVAAGDEGAAGAGDHECLRCGIGGERVDRRPQCSDHRTRQRVDRRVVDLDDADDAVAAIAHAGGHVRLLLWTRGSG